MRHCCPCWGWFRTGLLPSENNKRKPRHYGKSQRTPCNSSAEVDCRSTPRETGSGLKSRRANSGLRSNSTEVPACEIVCCRTCRHSYWKQIRQRAWPGCRLQTRSGIGSSGRLPCLWHGLPDRNGCWSTSTNASIIRGCGTNAAKESCATNATGMNRCWESSQLPGEHSCGSESGTTWNPRSVARKS